MKRLSLLAIVAFTLLCLPSLALAQDSDGDGMPDSYENTYGCLMPNTVDAATDYDTDRMTSLEEYTYSPLLNPCDKDTDDDTAEDGFETGTGSNPLDAKVVPSSRMIGGEVLIAQAPTYSETYVPPSLVWTGSEFAAAWKGYTDNDEIYLSRISASGTEIGAETRVTYAAGISAYPSMAWSGSEFGLTWPP